MTARPQTFHDAALSDAELVGLAQAGRHEAFAALMRRGNQRLFRVARSVLRDEGEAEDALQEAYVRAFAAIGDFRGEASVFTWLTRIVLNEAHARLRRRRPTVELDILDSAHGRSGQVLAFPGVDDPEQGAARAEVRRLLEHAVDDLPEGFRIVFVLRDIQGLSVEETAEAVGLKPETVKTRLHRARRLLRQALDAELASTLTGAFPFLGARCQRITETVLARLDGPARA